MAEEDPGFNLDALKAKLAFSKRELGERIKSEQVLQTRVSAARTEVRGLIDDLMDAEDRKGAIGKQHNESKEEEAKAEDELREVMNPKKEEPDGAAILLPEEEEAPAVIEEFVTREESISTHVQEVISSMRAAEHQKLLEEGPAGQGGEVIVEAKDFGLAEEHTLKIFKVADYITFAQLRQDVEDFWNLERDSVYLTTTKGIVWTGGANVMEHIKRLEEELLLYENFDDEDLYINAYPKPGMEPEEPERVRKKRQPRKPKSAADKDAEAWKLRNERLEGQLRWQVCFHLVFTVAVILLAIFRIPLKPAFEMMDSIQAVVEDDFPEELGHTQKNFADVANSEEMYAFLVHPWIGGMSEDPWMLGNNNLVVGGFRLRNLKVVGNESCTIYRDEESPVLVCYLFGVSKHHKGNHRCKQNLVFLKQATAYIEVDFSRDDGDDGFNPNSHISVGFRV